MFTGAIVCAFFSLMDLNWQPLNPALDLPWDLYTLGIAASCWGILYITLHTLLFKAKSEQLFPLTSRKDSKAIIQLRHKFIVSAWKFTTFFVMGSLGLIILGQEDWSLSQQGYWKGWPHHSMR